MPKAEEVKRELASRDPDYKPSDESRAIMESMALDIANATSLDEILGVGTVVPIEELAGTKNAPGIPVTIQSYMVRTFEKGGRGISMTCNRMDTLDEIIVNTTAILVVNAVERMQQLGFLPQVVEFWQAGNAWRLRFPLGTERQAINVEAS